MKGGVTMLLVAFLKCLADAPPGDVILALFADEEAGGACGAEYVVRHHAHLFAGVRHAIGEFGAFTFHFGGRRFFPIQIAEKRHCQLDLTFTGPGGHAAIPPKDTAISQAARFVARLERSPMPIKVSASAKAMFEQLSAGLPIGAPRALIKLLSSRLLAPVALSAMGTKARMFEPLIRSVITPTVVRAGTKRNVVPEQVVIEFDVRMVPGQHPGEIEAHIRRLLKGNGTLSIRATDAVNRDPDLSQFSLLAEIVRRIDPSAIPVPMLLPGVTDSRHLDALAIQTYGFLPMVLPSDMNFMSLIHGADERIPATTLAVGTEAIGAFISRYRG
jgi:acetylornithine deacetylase/succinyl-diaminopimelate desuccinylase-like protein